MQQQQLIFQTEAKTTQPAITRLTFNVPDIDGLFPGFKAGDFAVVYGPQSVTSLVSQLLVQAQLPKQFGGAGSKAVFIDAANSSSLSSIIHAAERQHLDSKSTLGNIVHMRAYTAYRLTSLLTEELEEKVETSDAKLVVISDIACSFLSDNVDDQEAKVVYGQIMSYLANFAKKHKVVVVATYLPHEDNRRNSMLKEITSAKANTVLKFTKTPYTSEFELEKHPTYMLGVVEFAPGIKVLTDFPDKRSATATLGYRFLEN